MDAATAKNIPTSLGKLLARFLLFAELALTIAEMHYIYATVISAELTRNSLLQQLKRTRKVVDANNITQIK